VSVQHYQEGPVDLPSQEYAAWPPGEDTVRCPHAYFRTLREHAPVYRYPGGGDDAPAIFIVTGWEEAASVLLRPQSFANHLGGLLPAFDENELPLPVPGAASFYEDDNVFFADGEDHRAKRAWVLRLVTRDNLEAFRPVVEAEVDRLIDAFIADGRCDFRGQFTDVMPMVVVRQIMGLPDAVDPMIKRMSRAISVSDNNPAQTPEQVAELQASSLAVLQACVEVLRSRQAAPLDGDYVSGLIAHQVRRDGAIDLNALAKHLMVTIFGADHAMGGHLADIAARLGRDPELQDKVRADRSLIRRLANESLRIESPVPWLFRNCVADAVVGSVTIPAGSLVLVASVAANRDPAKFPDPEAFDLDRVNVERDHLTLGRGVHRCAGAEMARLQADVTVNRLLDRLADIRLDEATSDLIPELSYGFRVPAEVHLTFRRAAG